MTHNVEEPVKCKTCMKKVDPRLWTEHQSTLWHRIFLVITAAFYMA